MNLGLTISFIIAGLLMITIVTLNVRMGQHSADITLHTMSQSHVSSVSDIVEFDFQKIGYNVQGPIENAISVAEENEIQFEANLTNDPSEAVQTISWRLDTDPISGSSNPRHRSLTRIVDGDTQDINVGVTRFELRYYVQGSHEPLTFPIDAATLENINRVEVILEIEPREGTGRNNYYTTSSWRKVFTPPNLNL
ncbi:MAG: hypothetical protein JJU46_13785 [Balneolaceae bacterium]|nr:hypothetical protein [Balneolaceae bacterium]MCH8548120.1 hypothetical protein [Balneolaceae bacterium]